MTIAARPQGLSDVAAGRLDRKTLDANFGDLHPPLSDHEASVESDRCYFCYEAPCQKACPTSIDIPLFIRQIAAGNRTGAAKTIFDANIMGGMCARVCPTETLCEEACVREAAEGKPVRIGLLQRYATDAADRDRTVALYARRADRKARGDRRRGARRPRLRARARGRRRGGRRSSRRTASRAASTNTASPPTRRSTTSPPGRPPSSCRSAASRCSTASPSARTSSSTSSDATTTPSSSPWDWARPTSSACRARASSKTSPTPSTISRPCARRRT